MSEFRKGDVVSVTGVVSRTIEGDLVGVDISVGAQVHFDTYFFQPSELTVIRRAQVELEKCEIGDGVTVRHAEYPEHYGKMVSRVTSKGGYVYALVDWESGEPGVVLVSDLLHVDVPVPAAHRGCYLSDIDLYIDRCGDGQETLVPGQRLREWRDSFNSLYYGPRPAWAPNADAPAPNKHVMINGHAVPMPMREPPTKGEAYYTLAHIGSTEPVVSYMWGDDSIDEALFKRGLCHATREAAQAHFDALIAPTKREGV